MSTHETGSFTPPRGHWGTPQGTSSRAHWMDPENLKGSEWQPAPGRLLLGTTFDGKPVAYADDRHLITIAGSRAGKTATMLIPNLRRYGGSAVVIDPKGELAENTAAFRAAMGQSVHILDPFGEVSKRGRLRATIEKYNLDITDQTARFNPLDTLHGIEPDYLMGEVAGLGDALITTRGADPHWTDSANKLLQAVALLLLSGESDHPVTLNTIVRFFANTDMQDELFAEMLTTDAFEGFLQDVGRTNKKKVASSSEYASIISTGDTQLAPLRDLSRVSARSDFDLADLKRKPMTIYLVLPASKMGSHYHWLRLIITLALTVLERIDWPNRGDDTPNPPPVLFVLEEFAALGNMRSIERAAGYMAGFGVKLWPVLQDLAQLRSLYRDSWQTFLGNAGMIQAFGLNDGSTEDYISQRLGMTQFDEPELRNINPQAPRTVNTQYIRRSGRLLEPHEVRLLFSRNTGRQIIMMSDFPPIALRRLPFE